MIDEQEMKRRERVKAELATVNPRLFGHLFGESPKRILSLDGGGVLGVIEIAFLERLEAKLRQDKGKPNLVLSDHFDLIGGTSTGAIIATGLALGMTTAQIRDLYFSLANKIFSKKLVEFDPRKWGQVSYVRGRFSAHPLAMVLKTIVGDRQLQSADLQTGLAIMAKRVDTASPWVFYNNPLNKHWDDRQPSRDDPGDRGRIGNKRYLLRNLIRASTAAPTYFSAQSIDIAEANPDRNFPKPTPGLFVDGGVSPFNNPALQLLMLAGVSGYGFDWPIRRDALSLTSIGTGWWAPTMPYNKARRMWQWQLAVHTLKGIIWDNNMLTLTMLQWLSRSEQPWQIDRALRDLGDDLLAGHLPVDEPLKELVQFVRYDLRYDSKWLHREAGIDIDDDRLEELKQFMNPAVMPEVYEIATAYAARRIPIGDATRQDKSTAQENVPMPT